MATTHGRPRDDRIDDAILDAMAALLPEHGFTRLTISAIAERAGTTKTAFYRRYVDLADAVGALLARRFGLDEDIDTGTLEGDLTAIQRRQVALFRDPVVSPGLVGFLEEARLNEGHARSFLHDFLGPRRSGVGVLLERAVERGELTGPVDSEWICDLITGPVLLRAVLPGLQPLDDALVANTVRSALLELGVTPSVG